MTGISINQDLNIELTIQPPRLCPTYISQKEKKVCFHDDICYRYTYLYNPVRQ